MKISRGPWARGPNLGGWAPRSPSQGARQALRIVFWGQNIENENEIDSSTVVHTNSHEGP